MRAEEYTESFIASGVIMLEAQPDSEWSASLLGNRSYIFRPCEGDEPNRFHRFMQRLCFGIVWKRDQ